MVNKNIIDYWSDSLILLLDLWLPTQGSLGIKFWLSVARAIIFNYKHHEVVALNVETFVSDFLGIFLGTRNIKWNSQEL